MVQPDSPHVTPAPRGRFSGRRYHFSGVGGSGMAPLAMLCASWGAEVTGSDRNHDRGLDLPVFAGLRALGIRLVPQDGCGVMPDLDAMVHSAAVEQANPDVCAAETLGVKRIRRGSFLAAIASGQRAIAVAGTSGKSTVTAMIAHILIETGWDPTFLGGGSAVSLRDAVPPGSLRLGASDWFVVETDESDGSVAEFSPAIAVLTNLSRDHKEIDETARNFAAMVSKTRERAVWHCSDPTLARVTRPEALPAAYVAVEGEKVWAEPSLVARSVRLGPSSVRFEIGDVAVQVPFPGALTVENAAIAVAAAVAAGVPLERAAAALASFAGVQRRLQRIGESRGVDVYDDFGHNPVKIAAALAALRPAGTLWIYYQPHGYGPTRFFREQLVETFASGLRPGDRLLLAPIYDAGGTADRSYRSENLVEDLRAAGVNAALAPCRPDAARAIAAGSRPGDRAVVMGARDDTLPAFASEILAALSRKPEAAPTPSKNKA